MTESSAPERPPARTWRSFFSTVSVHESSQTEDEKSALPKWSMGVLNDKETIEVPGSVLLLARDHNEPLGLRNAPARTSHSSLPTGLPEIAPHPPEDPKKRTADGKIILDPQPEDSANDPLNWPAWRRDLALLSLGFYCMLGGGITPILAAGFTDVADTYGVDVESVALTTGLFMMGLGVGAVLVSPTAILFGKRPIYLVSAFAFILTSVWCALSPSFPSLVAARVFQGMSLSPVECLPSATIAEIFFLHERAFRIGIYTLLLLGGKNLVPLVSAVIINSLDWRWVFWIVAIVGGFGLVILFFFVPETFWDRTPIPKAKRRPGFIRRLSSTFSARHHHHPTASSAAPPTAGTHPAPGAHPPPDAPAVHEELQPAEVTEAAHRDRHGQKHKHAHVGFAVPEDPLARHGHDERLRATADEEHKDGHAKADELTEATGDSARGEGKPKANAGSPVDEEKQAPPREPIDDKDTKADNESAEDEEKSRPLDDEKTDARGLHDAPKSPRAPRSSDHFGDPAHGDHFSRTHSHTVSDAEKQSEVHVGKSAYTHNLRHQPAKSFAQQLKPWHGRLNSDKWFKVLVRPFILFSYPSVLWSAAIYANSVGWLIVISETVAVIYRNPETYGFSALSTGLVYVSPFVGGVLGTAVAGKVSDIVVKSLAARNGGLYEPEFRLLMAAPVAITTVIGLMGFGWSAEAGNHWMVPTIFFGLVSFGCSLGSTTSITFCVDSYRQYAGEALVTLNFSKNIFHGLVFSLFIGHWVHGDGPKMVFIWIGVIQLICLLFTIPMYIYGKRARMWTVRKNFMEKF